MSSARRGGVGPLALTMGEPAGIGGEIALKAWSGGDAAPFFVVDDPARLEGLARRLDLAVPVRAIDAPAEATEAFRAALPVLPQALPAEAVLGRPDAANAAAVIAAIEAALACVRAGEAAALVTNPIHKRTLLEAGFTHPGHTEFLGALAGTGTPPVMMLACAELRVVPVTVHMGLRDALAVLDAERIVAAASVAAEALRRDFGVAAPRLAVAGLNPHAGEDGRMGGEEEEIIAPAVATLQQRGIDAFGPVAADTLFRAAARRRFDAAICMYHDQALIPIKAIAFDTAVNVTLGLPFVRTSPDHGTALDIAGQGRATETSLVAALNLAAELARRRADAR